MPCGSPGCARRTSSRVINPVPTPTFAYSNPHARPPPLTQIRLCVQYCSHFHAHYCIYEPTSKPTAAYTNHSISKPHFHISKPSIAHSNPHSRPAMHIQIHIHDYQLNIQTCMPAHHCIFESICNAHHCIHKPTFTPPTLHTIQLRPISHSKHSIKVSTLLTHMRYPGPLPCPLPSVGRRRSLLQPLSQTLMRGVRRHPRKTWTVPPLPD